jgi:hypothetical protein
MLVRLHALATQRKVSVALIVRSIVEHYFKTVDADPGHYQTGAAVVAGNGST